MYSSNPLHPVLQIPHEYHDPRRSAGHIPDTRLLRVHPSKNIPSGYAEGLPADPPAWKLPHNHVRRTASYQFVNPDTLRVHIV